MIVGTETMPSHQYLTDMSAGVRAQLDELSYKDARALEPVLVHPLEALAASLRQLQAFVDLVDAGAAPDWNVLLERVRAVL